MFCGKCGAQNADNAPFCSNCGAPLNASPGPSNQQPGYQQQGYQQPGYQQQGYQQQGYQQQGYQQPGYQQQGYQQQGYQQQGYQQQGYQQQGYQAPVSPAPNNSDKNRRVGIIAVAAAAAVVLVVLIVVFVNLFGGRSYEKVVDIYIKSTFKPDAAAIIDLMPKKMIDYALEDAGYDDDELDEFTDQLDDILQNVIDTMDDQFDDWEVTHKIRDDEDLSRSDLKDLKEEYEEYDIKITAAKTLDVKITIEYDDGDFSQNMDISVIKIGNSWYLDVLSMGGLT